LNLKSTLKSLKLNESTISLILGVIVIVVVGVLVINYFRGQEEGQTIPPIGTEEIKLPTTHVVAEGEDLWSISEIYYQTGYNWIDISKENDIINPNELEVGRELSIPDVEPRLASEDVEVSPTTVEDMLTTISEDGKNIHLVSIGESLWSIAERYYDSGFNWVDIAKENELTTPNLIDAGQKLTIPDVEPKTPTVKIQDAISGATYEVQKGDHLWGISIRAYGDGYKWSAIAKENNLANPDIIHAGNKLSLPR
jgi:nucleoid-associated protein YgaU